MASTNNSDDLVITPQGPMPKSQVHLIENGYHLELRGNHVLKILTAFGEMKEDFGAVKQLSSPQTGGSNSTKTASGFKKLSSSLIHRIFNRTLGCSRLKMTKVS